MVLLLLTLVFALVIEPAMAENVIGLDRVLRVNTVPFLTDPGNAHTWVFNYFFTIEILCALIALFFRWIGRVMRS